MGAQYLNRLSWKKVDSLKREKTTIVIPVASTEQHGYHLPLSTDTSIMEHVLMRLVQEMPVCARHYLIAPLIPFGVSPEHLQFAGSISLRCSTLSALLSDMVYSLSRNGFTDYVILNSHGGNSPFLESITRELRIAYRCDIRLVDVYGKAFYADMPPVLEGTYTDIHGGEYETSLMMRICPQLVEMDWEEASLKTTLTGLPPAWLTHEISQSGIIGDATLASENKGEQFDNYMLKRLSQLLLEHAQAEDS